MPLQVNEIFSRVHQRNLRITPAPSNLIKYAQKTPCTKTPLIGGERHARLFPTRKKNSRNETEIPTGFGNPVNRKSQVEVIEEYDTKRKMKSPHPQISYSTMVS